MKAVTDEIGWVIGFELWPSYYVIVIVYLMLSDYIINKHSNPREKLSCAYNNVTLFDKDNLHIYWLVVAVIIIMFPVLCAYNVKCFDKIGAILDKIEIFSSTVIGLQGIVITLTVFIVVFDKKYYLVFSIKEILEEYQITKVLKIEVYSCIMTCISSCALLHGKIQSWFDLAMLLIFEFSFIIYIISTVYLLITLINIMFTNKELGLLKQIYERYWTLQINTDNIKKNWKWQNTKINVKYLADRFIDIAHKKRIRRIQQIEYVYVNDKYREVYLKFAKKTAIRVTSMLLLIEMFISVFIIKKCVVFSILTNIFFEIVLIIMCRYSDQYFDNVISLLYFGKKGYDIIKNDNKHSALITAVPLRKLNKYDKYLNAMNSLTAFFFIWVKDVKIENYEMQEEFAKQVAELINYFRYKRCENCVDCFPLFIIGYMSYNINIAVDEIKHLYNQIVKTKESKFIFQKMVYSQIFYIYSFRDCKNSELTENICKYFEWLNNNPLKP